MSKTYDLTATLNTGRLKNSDWVSDAWTKFFYNSDDPVGYSGYDDPRYYATNMLFDQSTLSSLRTKVSNGITVTGLTLTVQCVQPMTGETYIGYKYNNTASGNSASQAWARSTNVGNPSGAGDTSDTLAYIIPAQSLSTGAQTFNLYRTDPNTGVARPFSGIPRYGLVAGPRRLVSGRWRFTSATLHVTTNETDYSYTLAYDLKGGSGTFANQTGSNTLVSPSYTFSIYSSTPTKAGHTFLGWSTSSSATSASYSAGGSITVTSSGTTTLYAVWKVDTYIVTYSKGSASGATGNQQTDTKTYGVDLTLKGAIFTRTGYTQTGWSTSDGGAKSYDLGPTGKYATNAAATLYPYWTAVTYTVTYKPGSYSSGSNYTATKTYGVALTLRGSTYTRSNYSQDGWSVNANGSTKDYNLSGSYTNNSGATLYPHWKADTYTVSYNANGGSGAPAAQTKTYGVNLTLSSTVPTRTNYIFLGWATSSTGTATYCTGTSHNQNTTYSTNAAVTLYAIWQAAKSTLSSITSEVSVKSNVAGSGTASWNIVNTAYTYTLVITYSNAPAVTVNVAANNSSTSFSIPTTWLSYMPNVNSATATATLTTYASGTSVGSTSLTFTVKVDDSVKPTISSFTHAPYAQNSTVNGWQVYVQGYSQVDLSVSASAGTGASITDITFSGTGITKDTQHPTATTARSAVLTNTGRISGYSVTVTDSRGRSASAEITGDNRPYFYEYSYPAITSITGFRSNSNGDVDSIGGTYIHTSAKFKFSDCGTNHNQLTIQKVEYKLHSASQWTSAVDPATSEQEYTIGGGNINITSSYDVRYTIKDSLLHEATATVLVPPIVGFAVGLKNDRARFGGPVEKAGLQVDWDAEFNGVVDVVPRRCIATLSSEGWYRVMTFNGTSANDANGYAGSQIDFTIGRDNGANRPENHNIRFHLIAGVIKFDSEQSTSNAMRIDKIRYCRNGSNGYVDIHYSYSTQNNVFVNFTVCDHYSRQYRYVATNFTPAATSPVSPETLIAEYTFVANTGGKITFTPSNCSVYRACWYARIGNVCYLHIDISGLTANTNTYIFTLPVGFRPGDYMALRGSGQESWAATARATISTSGDINIYSTDRYALVDGSFICVT